MSEQNKAQKALDYFNLGYNCAQSVFTAYHEEMGLSENEALKLSSSMGGGVGGLREVCGAFCGLSMVLGALRGYDSPTDMDAKKAHYALIQEKAADFTSQFDTADCRAVGPATASSQPPCLRSAMPNTTKRGLARGMWKPVPKWRKRSLQRNPYSQSVYNKELSLSKALFIYATKPVAGYSRRVKLQASPAQRQMKHSHARIVTVLRAVLCDSRYQHMGRKRFDARHSAAVDCPHTLS